MVDANQEARWIRTRRLGLLTLAAAALVLAAIVVLASSLDLAAADGFPLSYVLAIAGLPVILAAIVFWFADRQETIDRRLGLFED